MNLKDFFKENKYFYLFYIFTFTFFSVIIFLNYSFSLSFALSSNQNEKEAEKELTPNLTQVQQPVTEIFFTIDNLPLECNNIKNPIYDTQTVQDKLAQNPNASLSLPKLPKYYAPKVVYLTFDDGPDPLNTPQVLKILNQEKIPATFFVMGMQVKLYPQLIKNIFDAGHAIGIHSYNHDYKVLYASPNNYLSQMLETENLIHSIIGVRPLISRAPGGACSFFTKKYWQILKDYGYLNFDWNISSGDASNGKANDLINNIKAQINNSYLQSHAIVLMHDGSGHEETVKALPSIIKLFRENNFEFRVINLTTPEEW